MNELFTSICWTSRKRKQKLARVFFVYIFQKKKQQRFESQREEEKEEVKTTHKWFRNLNSQSLKTYRNKHLPIHWSSSCSCWFARRTPKQQKSIYSGNLWKVWEIKLYSVWDEREGEKNSDKEWRKRTHAEGNGIKIKK